MSKKGICELCGFSDNSYSIEENGTVMKVCKFCHDGYLERMGIDPEADKPVSDITLTLDLDSAKAGEDKSEQGESLTMKIEPLTEEELKKVLTVSGEDKRALGSSMKKKQVIDERRKAQEELYMKTADKNPKAEKQAVRTTAKLSDRILKENERLIKALNRRDEIMRAVNAGIDDERITITSPEVELKEDVRPKSNLDVAASEDEKSVRFLSAFRYVFHKISYAVFLGIIVLAVSVVSFIFFDWQSALIVLGTGAGAVVLGFFLMWYLSSCYEKDRRTHLFRIKQQEILFSSMTSESYRELKTKYTVLRSLAWLLGRLSLLLPLCVLVCGAAGSVVGCFLYQYWLFAPVLGGAIVAAIAVYYLFKLLCDAVYCSLDKERNQQITQQTLLDILKELKGKK